MGKKLSKSSTDQSELKKAESGKDGWISSGIILPPDYLAIKNTVAYSPSQRYAMIRVVTFERNAWDRIVIVDLVERRQIAAIEPEITERNAWDRIVIVDLVERRQIAAIEPEITVERWSIEKKLGEGGFGAVYRCRDPTGQYALKVEGVNEQIQVLKLEVVVLTELTKRQSRHFCTIQDKGRYGSFNYVVMTLVGKSLQDLNKGGPGMHMTLGCSISVGMQALEALEDLHGIGYLHRDVKPGNYTIGRAELNELRKIYILDFGMCRRFTNEQGVIRKPRQAAGFRGTVRYAPISCHLQRELCRKDDVEVWVYMQVELTFGRLPWKEVQDMNQVGEYKKKVRNPQFVNELFPPPCPRELIEVLQHVDQCKYYDAPNYQMIYGLMKRALASAGAQEFPYDWEMGGPSAHVLA